MSYFSLISTIALSSVLFIIYRIICTYFSLATLPGPFWSRITNLPRVAWVKSGHAHVFHQRLHDVHGRVVRLGPNTVSVSDPDAIPTIYPTREGFPKSDFYRVQRPYTRKDGEVAAIFNTQDEDLHRRLRKPVAYLYSMTNVVTLEPFVDQALCVMFDQLDRRYATSEGVCDLGNWLQYFAYDVMGTLTFSKRYSFLEEGRDVNGILMAVEKFMNLSSVMGQVPWLDRLLYKNPVSAFFQNTAGSKILTMVNQYIKEKQEQKPTIRNESCKLDMLSHFLHIQETNPNIPSNASKAWTFANVKAGSDSTASVMQTMLYQLLRHPDSMNRLLKELYQTTVENSTSDDMPLPAWKSIRNLDYLDACFMEALRLHPPFCLPLERVVQRGGIMISGHYLPQGTVVGINPYVSNRNPSLFGKDVSEWRPERWIELDPAQRQRMERGVLSFGAGRRSCLGKNIAILEAKKTIAALFLRYEMRLVDPKQHRTENAWFFRQWGIIVTIKKRK
ncbi:uncharacterized protein N7487_001132 [Penicillium crustosum]|uniref:uncharacterized protein n=1 Tax=Penicillium crustosum TaxID=36656 RepID=UPI0023841D9E|nr:uncharacterized protein N7487_001132 [Penicillium crustosum]KAJ5417582.1 hypothetical protein N7487_001132 [Penicillium crustosum]